MGFIARFFLLVLVLSFGELYLLILAAERISIGVTLMLCVLTGVVGGAMVRAQGVTALSQINKTMAQGKVPGVEIVSGLMLLMIGTMMLTPGFITDSIAFLLLIPPLRKLAAGYILSQLKKRVQFSSVDFPPPTARGNGDPNIIDVESHES